MYCEHKWIEDNCLTRKHSTETEWNIYKFCMVCKKNSYRTVSTSCPEYRSSVNTKYGERISFSDKYKIIKTYENASDEISHVKVTDELQRQFEQQERKILLGELDYAKTTFKKNEEKYHMLSQLKKHTVYMIEE